MIATPLWLPATLFAGALNAWRMAVQRRVSHDLSVNAAGLVRYLYGFPVALALLMIYQALRGGPWPAVGAAWLPYCALAGFLQILGTNALIMAFAHRNFVVGTAYSKTEAVQGAILSFLLLGERLSWISWLGIGCGVVGIMVLSTGGQRLGPRDFLRAMGQKAALLGMASGGLFALTSIAVKWAAREVATPDPVQAALIVLAATVGLQMLMQGSWVLWREREQMRRIFSTWRVSGQVGVLAATGSACWFTGFATAPVALVRIVGQVEVIFTLAFAHFYLRERMARSEVTGLILVAAGVVLALWGAF